MAIGAINKAVIIPRPAMALEPTEKHINQRCDDAVVNMSNTL